MELRGFSVNMLAESFMSKYFPTQIITDPRSDTNYFQVARSAQERVEECQVLHLCLRPEGWQRLCEPLPLWEGRQSGDWPLGAEHTAELWHGDHLLLLFWLLLLPLTRLHLLQSASSALLNDPFRGEEWRGLHENYGRDGCRQGGADDIAPPSVAGTSIRWASSISHHFTLVLKWVYFLVLFLYGHCQGWSWSIFPYFFHIWTHCP